MPNPDRTRVRYRDAGGTLHQVLVHRTADGAWQIVDTTPGREHVIDTLRGHGDGRPQATAVARDYAARHDHRDTDSLGVAA